MKFESLIVNGAVGFGAMFVALIGWIIFFKAVLGISISGHHIEYAAVFIPYVAGVPLALLFGFVNYRAAYDPLETAFGAPGFVLGLGLCSAIFFSDYRFPVSENIYLLTGINFIVFCVGFFLSYTLRKRRQGIQWRSRFRMV